MRRMILGLVLAVAMVTLFAGAALAHAPVGPVDSPPPAHTHHVHLNNGNCVDIDAVKFVPDSHGLHQGSNATGNLQGPDHGTCAEPIHHGGVGH